MKDCDKQCEFRLLRMFPLDRNKASIMKLLSFTRLSSLSAFSLVHSLPNLGHMRYISGATSGKDKKSKRFLSSASTQRCS